MATQISTGPETGHVLAMDAEQQAVIRHGSGPLLVLGGPGTGKTVSLRERFAALVDAGADPERIALVVRSRRDRVAARTALLRRLRGSLPVLRVTTIHGLAYHVVNARFAALGYERPPDVLTASDQFAKVHELLRGEQQPDWPAYGSMLGLRGFADQVRQFLIRAQESLLTPADVLARADAQHLSGWPELAAFYGRYLRVLDDEEAVDFAGLVEQAAAAAEASRGQPLFDHLLVDDYQDATFSAERLLAELGAETLVAAGDPQAHVFSFQGTTDAPIRRFTHVLPTAGTVTLATDHRDAGVVSQAWSTPHTSEEHTAIARELRRTHVEEGVAWGQMAVVVRRQGSHLGGLLRALDDARVPRSTPERGLSLRSEPATAPFVLALRWLAFPQERDALVESVLTSDLGGLSPAAARGLIRAAQADADADGAGAGQRGHRAVALVRTDGLQPAEAEGLATLAGVLDRAEAVADRSAADAFRILWTGLPLAARLVAAGESSPEARRDLDAVAALAGAIAGVSERGDTSVAAFLTALGAEPDGPGFAFAEPAADDAADTVRVYTAHGAAGQEFDTVIVAGVVEGNFPSLSRPEPMFDLAVLERRISQSERNRMRLEDERRLFRLVIARARRRVVLTASDPHGEATQLSGRSRFVKELGVAWTAAPATPFAEPVEAAEAAAAWRRRLADVGAGPASRLAALHGIRALGVDPLTWWFQRSWTGAEGPLHEHLRVSYSRLDKLENCALQFVLGQELGLEGESGYHAWVGHLVHRLIEDCENGMIERTAPALVAEAERRWQPQRFPSLAVSEAFRALVTRSILPAWVREFGDAPVALARERRFAFPFADAEIVGSIDRIGPLEGGGTQITDYKTGKSRNVTKAGDNLQLGIYYLAVSEAPELAAFRPVRAVELAFLRDVDRSGAIARTVQTFLGDEAEFRERMSDRLTGLIEQLRELQETENYRPNPAANCRFCDFKPLCPLWPEGRDAFPVVAAGAGSAS